MFSVFSSISFYFFLKNLNFNILNVLIYKYFIVFPNFNFFGLILLFIATYFSFLIMILAENKINKKIIFNILIIFFPTISFFYVFTNNLILFFFIYELFLVPSVYLVYYLSPNKRSLVAVFYFLIWTQLGSFLVFIFVIIVLQKGNVWLLSMLPKVYFTNSTKKLLFFLIFMGFGIKVPIWPFYYWLTKTHVEAPTFFSIYLSGFLVKTALYGFYKLFFFLIFENLYIYITILLFGVCDVSLKFFSQVDLKKLVAYSTVQEMNLIYMGLLWGSKKSIVYVSLFSLTHTLLSTMFFFIIDIIYKRYYSRSIYNINGLFLNYPTISLLLILSCLNYNGFPLSLKFFLEIFFFLSLFEMNAWGSLLVLIILNWVGTVNFTYLWFRTLFGVNHYMYDTYNLDITKKELTIYWITFYIFYQYIYFIVFLF